VHNNLFNTIRLTSALTEEDKALCEQYFEAIDCKRNTIIEAETKVPKHLYFVNDGYLRLFHYDEQGDEVTSHFGSPNHFVTPFLSFIHQQKSPENLECITDCNLLRIERSQMMHMIEASETFKSFSLIIFQEAMATTQIRANDFATLTAELRYKKLLEQQPEIIQNVPIQYIASYLGIKPQSLSRIRKGIIK
jgi:CRP/FNR family transcriptional regulator, anaerobic regulatory protein